MNGAIIYRWGPSVRGREKESIDVFTEAVAYWSGLVDNGRVASQEPYFSHNRDGGYWIIKGDVEALETITREADYRRLVLKVHMITEDFSMELLTGGSVEDLDQEVQLLQEVAGQFA